MSTKIKHVSLIGTSQTDYAAGYGVDGFNTHQAQLMRMLKAGGIDARVHAFGVSGATSQDFLGRVADVFFYNQSDAAIIEVGVNDPGASISTSQTQANIEAIILAVKHKAIGDRLGSGSIVADQTALPDNGRFGDRYVVLNDTSTSGGIAAYHGAHHTTITGSVAADSNGQKQAVWEYRYNLAGVMGWGRVADKDTPPLKDVDDVIEGCASIIVPSTNYLNFVTGGDTPSTPYSVYANVRSAQLAAVNEQNGNGSVVSYANLYSLMRDLIVSGPIPDFSSVAYDQTKSWHYTQDNQHHNAFGQNLAARVEYAPVFAALS